MNWYKTKTCRLLSMLLLTFSFFLVELIFGYVTNSLALIGDSYHMLSDVVALVVGIASVRVSQIAMFQFQPLEEQSLMVLCHQMSLRKYIV